MASAVPAGGTGVDGSEFAEYSFGGNGTADSLTGTHHILTIVVIIMASAHSTPTSGGENKAAIVAQIDPVDGRFLYRNAAGRMRLLGSVDLLAGTLLLSHVNVLSEYVPHNISDSDFTLTGPAIVEMNAVLTQAASQFGFNSTDNSKYQNKFRDRLLTYLSAVRLLTIYGNSGLDGVVAEITKIKVKLNELGLN